MIASTSAALRSGAECQLRGVFSAASASATLNWDKDDGRAQSVLIVAI